MDPSERCKPMPSTSSFASEKAVPDGWDEVFCVFQSTTAGSPRPGRLETSSTENGTFDFFDNGSKSNATTSSAVPETSVSQRQSAIIRCYKKLRQAAALSESKTAYEIHQRVENCRRVHEKLMAQLAKDTETIQRLCTNRLRPPPLHQVPVLSGGNHVQRPCNGVSTHSGSAAFAQSAASAGAITRTLPFNRENSPQDTVAINVQSYSNRQTRDEMRRKSAASTGGAVSDGQQRPMYMESSDNPLWKTRERFAFIVDERSKRHVQPTSMSHLKPIEGNRRIIIEIPFSSACCSWWSRSKPLPLITPRTPRTYPQFVNEAHSDDHPTPRLSVTSQRQDIYKTRKATFKLEYAIPDWENYEFVVMWQLLSPNTDRMDWRSPYVVGCQQKGAHVIVFQFDEFQMFNLDVFFVAVFLRRKASSVGSIIQFALPLSHLNIVHGSTGEFLHEMSPWQVSFIYERFLAINSDKNQEKKRALAIDDARK